MDPRSESISSDDEIGLQSIGIEVIDLRLHGKNGHQKEHPNHQSLRQEVGQGERLFLVHKLTPVFRKQRETKQRGKLIHLGRWQI